MDGYGGILCNSSYVWRASLSRHNSESTYILQVEFHVIHHDLSLVKSMSIHNSVCYTASSLWIKLIESSSNKFHKHVVLIQDIKNMLRENSHFRIIHILQEGNRCDDFFSKLGISFDVDHLIYASPQSSLQNMLDLLLEYAILFLFFIFFLLSLVTTKKVYSIFYP